MNIVFDKVQEVQLDQFDADNVTLIRFGVDITEDDVVTVIERVCQVEEQYFEQHKQMLPIEYRLKNLSTETLIKCLKFAINRETLINSSLILNINLLINGYNTLDDSLFESEEVYVNDLEQLLDVKLDLSDDIRALQTTVTYWYLGCLKSMYKTDYTYLDTVVEVPMLCKRILAASNFLTLSQIMVKADNIETGKLPLVADAYSIVADIVETSGIANQILGSLIKYE